jgi:hypothetical protein
MDHPTDRSCRGALGVGTGHGRSAKKKLILLAPALVLLIPWTALAVDNDSVLSTERARRIPIRG